MGSVVGSLETWLKNLTQIDILKYGTFGLGFLLALLAAGLLIRYYLKPDNKDAKPIYAFMIFAFCIFLLGVYNDHEHELCAVLEDSYRILRHHVEDQVIDINKLIDASAHAVDTCASAHAVDTCKDNASNTSVNTNAFIACLGGAVHGTIVSLKGPFSALAPPRR
jgi:hypothetical protein